MEYITIILWILGAGGSIAGYISLALYIKKLRSKVEINGTKGSYRVADNLHMKIHAEFFIYNGKEEAIAITDVLGTLKYDPRYIEQLKKKNIHRLVFSCRAKNTFNIMPININPKTSEKLSFVFTFDNVDVPSLMKMDIAEFKGFINGNIPLVTVDDTKNRENNPIMLQIAIHTNLKDILKSKVSLYPTEEFATVDSGTISPIEQAKLEYEFAHKNLNERTAEIRTK